MVTYDDIRKANQSVTPIDLKGREYTEVNQRIKAFRMVYPTGTIETDMLSNEDGVCVFHAAVRAWIDGCEVLLGTGTAYEREGSSFINKTSYIENCETSAVGRALGMAGFGIDTSVASAEEVQNAQLNQQISKMDTEKPTEAQLNVIREAYKGENLRKLLEHNQVERIEDLSKLKVVELIRKLSEREAAK